MLFYTALLAGIGAFGVMFCFNNREKHSLLMNRIFLAVTFVTLAWISCVRYDVGYDYSYIYAPFYEKILLDPDYPYFGGGSPGFVFIAKVTALFSRNYQALFVVTSLLTLFLIFMYFWKYSPEPVVSVFLYVALSQYYCGMDFIRQTLAAAICLFAFEMLKERTFLHIIGYFSLVIIAATIHESALIMLLFFFINIFPYNKVTFIAYPAVTVLVFVFMDPILEFITSKWYSKYDMDTSEHMLAGFEWAFTAAYLVTYVLIFLGIKHLTRANPRNLLYVNYAYFAFFFALMGMKHSILDRFSLYFMLTIPVAIAIIVSGMMRKLPSDMKFSRRIKSPATYILLGGVCASFAIHTYALYRDHHGVVPYQTVYEQPWYSGYKLHLNDAPPEPPEPVDDFAETFDVLPEAPEEIFTEIPAEVSLGEPEPDDFFAG